MPIKLSPETREKISSLCKKISVAHNLDDEIQKELFCHMEDKLTCYISGDEKITEEDAFILVEKHFGDLKTIKSLYQDVEAVEAHVSFAKRVGAVFAASLCAGITMSIISIILLLLKKWSLHGETISYQTYSISLSFIVLSICTYIFSLLFLWRILLNWKKRIDKGEHPWFLTMKPLKFFIIIISLLFIDSVFPFINYNNVLQLVKTPDVIREKMVMSYIVYFKIDPVLLRHVFTTFRLRQQFFVWLSLVYLFFQCMAWLWWCDRPPRRFRYLIYAVIIWFAYSSIIPNFQPANILTFDRSTLHFISEIKFLNLNEYSILHSMIPYSLLGAFTFLVYSYLKLIYYLRIRIESKILSRKITR